MYKKNILLIGGGTIGEIFLQELLKLTDAKNITVAQRSVERREYLQNTYHIIATPLTSELALNKNIIFLAVKPQDITTVAETISSNITKQLLCSVMAGISTSKLAQLFHSNNIVRIMPNTPAKIGLGMSAWTATPTVTEIDKQLIKDLLKLLGQELYVSNDDWIDKATAVSGSGPAYVFLFAEQLINAAKQLGFNEIPAGQLVIQTLLGASTLLAQNKNAVELRQKVTSKDGTTAAALNSLAQTNLQTIWNKAVQAAYERAKDLTP
ncbi:MAG: pyrroline-5-carboxylate reductase [Patescibacteria group bacterium]|jgi:pyrroline-5-carboxylate reductase